MQFVIGNAPPAAFNWSGQMKGLAIYDRESVERDEVSQNYADWTERQVSTTSGRSKMDVLLRRYLFSEGAGNVVHNQVDQATGLLIPERFFVLHRNFWNGHGMSSSTAGITGRMSRSMSPASSHLDFSFARTSPPAPKIRARESGSPSLLALLSASPLKCCRHFCRRGFWNDRPHHQHLRDWLWGRLLCRSAKHGLFAQAHELNLSGFQMIDHPETDNE